MTTPDTWIEEKRDGLAQALIRYGLIGFWVQLVFLVIVALLGIYTLLIIGSGTTLSNILSFVVLALPVFTTFWCRRYTSIGRSMASGERIPSPAGLGRQLWIGVWVGTAGSVASLLSLFGAASALLVTMLANPQVGLQVSPATGAADVYSVSAIDAVSIMSLLLTLTAELIVVFLSLRLVFIAERALRR